MLHMNEKEFQEEFLRYIEETKPGSVFIPKLKMTYLVGKYYTGKIFGFPDFEIDIIEIDEAQNFHLWEVKLLSNQEIWNAKVLGQILAYDYLFKTEPWSELLGRVLIRVEALSPMLDEKIEFISGAIMKNANQSNTYYANDSQDEVINSEPAQNFKTWNILICGGKGYEIAKGFNPMAWSLLDIYRSSIREHEPGLNIWQFYMTDKPNLINIYDVSVEPGNFSLGEIEKKFFLTDYPDWFKE